MTESGSMTEALLKTKTLLHKIGQVQPGMIGWVSKELTGYTVQDSLPEYRTVRGSLTGNITNGHYSHNSVPVPIGHLTAEQRDQIEISPMTESLGVLERMVHEAKPGSSLILQMEPEICTILSQVLGNGYFIQRAWTQIEVSQVRQILIEVRSRLLDFVLGLQGQLGDTVTDSDAKAAAAKIDVPSMFAGAVIGDNAVFQIMGENNQQRVSNRNVKGDREALTSELRKYGVSDDDIQTLTAAIVEDPVPSNVNQYGPAVRGWMSRMLGKAVDGSWDIGVSAAGTLLASVLQQYYGLRS